MDSGMAVSLGSRVDVAVVGGGSAGCVLAARLSEDRERSVCLIEAGPDYGPYDAGSWPADILDARALAFSHSWATDRDDRSQLRARILGGCSAHNACVLLEGAPSDYDWGTGWSHAVLEPYLRRAERMLRARRFAHVELSPWHRAFAELGGDDVIVHPVNALGTVRWNTAFAYLDEARDRPNLTILADTLTDRIDLERRQVVTPRGEIGASRIVIAAGAYGSPGILLRSGIGPGLQLDLPVGEGLADHVGAGIGWEPAEMLKEATLRFQAEAEAYMGQVTLLGRSSLCEEGVWDQFLFPALDPGCEISAGAFAMKPASRGRVRLRSADPEDPLEIDHGFLSDPADVTVVADGIEELRRLVAQPALRRYIAAEVRPGASVAAEDHVRAAPRGFFHPVGTCAMGAVVDPAGRVLGLDDVFVVDASIIPSIPRANPNLTVVALAERLAEQLASL